MHPPASGAARGDRSEPGTTPLRLGVLWVMFIGSRCLALLHGDVASVRGLPEVVQTAHCLNK